MTGDKNKKRGSNEKVSIDILGAQRLASKLQKVIRLGTSTKQEMKEVDIFFYTHLSTPTKNILNELNILMNKSWSSKSRKLLNEIYFNIFNVLNELSSLQQFGYNDIVDSNGNVNSVKLNMLIDIDTEISSFVSLLKHNVTKLESNAQFIKLIHNQIEQLITLLIELLQKRQVFIES